MSLGKNLRYHRTKMGFTLAQLSEMSGVDVGTISALEIRDSSRSKYFSPLAKAMGLSVEQLEDESRESTAPTALPTIKPAPVAKPCIPTLPAPKTRRQQSLDEVARLASLLDDFGLHRLIGMASVLLEQHHVSAKQTHKSSQ